MTGRSSGLTRRGWRRSCCCPAIERDVRGVRAESRKRRPALLGSPRPHQLPRDHDGQAPAPLPRARRPLGLGNRIPLEAVRIARTGFRRYFLAIGVASLFMPAVATWMPLGIIPLSIWLRPADPAQGHLLEQRRPPNNPNVEPRETHDDHRAGNRGQSGHRPRHSAPPARVRLHGRRRYPIGDRT